MISSAVFHASSWHFAVNYRLYSRYLRKDTEPAVQDVQSLQTELGTIDSVARSWNLGLISDEWVVICFYKSKIYFDAQAPVSEYPSKVENGNVNTMQKYLGVHINKVSDSPFLFMWYLQKLLCWQMVC